MNQRRAFIVLCIFYWLAAAVELGGGVVYAVHRGWLTGRVGVGAVSVLIVEESGEREKLTPGQREILTSHREDGFLHWIEHHGERDKGGAYRIVDKDDSMELDEPKWQTAFRAKGDRVPWLVVLRGSRVLLSEAMPREAGETMRVLRRFGGQ